MRIGSESLNNLASSVGEVNSKMSGKRFLLTIPYTSVCVYIFQSFIKILDAVDFITTVVQNRDLFLGYSTNPLT